MYWYRTLESQEGSQKMALEQTSLPGLDTLSDAASTFAGAAAADNTKRAYSSDWADFAEWCEVNRRQALPADPNDLADYIAALAGPARNLKASTIHRRCSAISTAHRLAGYSSPLQGVARETMSGIRRTLGTAPDQVTPIGMDELRQMVHALPHTTKGTRDRALLLLGFAGALRRSELVALDVSDVTDSPDGLLVMLGRSKTDQEEGGRTVGIPYGSHPGTCPVRAIRTWLEVAQIERGPIFRSVDQHGIIAPTRLADRSVARIIQSTAEKAGLDPSKFAGHSLRAGLATAAAAAGVSEHDIARTTGHRSVAVLRRYVRTATVFERNAAGSVGL
jgi:site-specific recombinase XerD